MQILKRQKSYLTLFYAFIKPKFTFIQMSMNALKTLTTAALMQFAPTLTVISSASVNVVSLEMALPVQVCK